MKYNIRSGCDNYTKTGGVPENLHRNFREQRKLPKQHDGRIVKNLQRKTQFGNIDELNNIYRLLQRLLKRIQ